MLGSKLRDVRSVLRYLRSRNDVDPKRIAIWGESLADVNDAAVPAVIPRGIDDPNRQAEPTSGLLALLAGLFADDLVAVCARGSFDSVRSLFVSPMLHVPHDVVVPKMIEAGDIADLVAVQSPRPIRLGAFVDGTNRRVPAAERRWSAKAERNSRSPVGISPDR